MVWSARYLNKINIVMNKCLIVHQFKKKPMPPINTKKQKHEVAIQHTNIAQSLNLFKHGTIIDSCSSNTIAIEKGLLSVRGIALFTWITSS
jgi:hypothetical protein